MRLTAICFAISFSTVGAAQSTWVVDANGGAGSQFLQIADAIAAAAPGDTIRVRSAAYASFTLDKGLAILGAGNVVVVRGFDVVGIPLGQSARVSRLEVASSPLGTFSLRNNAGEVHLSEVDTNSSFGDSSIVNSALVTLSNCDLRANGGAAVSIVGSTAQVSGCFLRGSPFALSNGGPAMLCEASRVSVSDSVLEGADGPPPHGFPTDAIAMRAGSIVTLGSGTVGRAGIALLPAFVVRATGGLLVLDPDASLVPSVGLPAISGSATVVTRRVPSDVIIEARAGGQFAGRLFAPAGVPFGTFVALPTAPLPTPFGDLWLSAPLTLVVGGTMPAEGEHTFRFPVSASTPPGIVLGLQSAVLENGELFLSAGATTVLGL